MYFAMINDCSVCSPYLGHLCSKMQNSFNKSARRCSFYSRTDALFTQAVLTFSVDELKEMGPEDC